MNDKKVHNFTGSGFSQEDFSPEERAIIRERAHHFDRHSLTVGKMLDETGLRWVSTMAKGFPAFIRVFATISVIGGAIIILQKTGWF